MGSIAQAPDGTLVRVYFAESISHRRLILLRRYSLLLLLVVVTLLRSTAVHAASGAPTDSFYVDVQWGGPGEVIPAGNVGIARGGNQTFVFVPAGCAIAGAVTVDDVEVGALSQYTFTNVQSDHALYVPFGIRSGGVTLGAAPALGSCAVRETLTADVPGATEGRVRFYVDGGYLGSGEVFAGKAQFVAYNPLDNGAHEVTADYLGSSCVGASAAEPLGYAVSDAGPGIVDIDFGLFGDAGNTFYLPYFYRFFRMYVLKNRLNAIGITGQVELFEAGRPVPFIAVSAPGFMDFAVDLPYGDHEITCRFTPGRCYPSVERTTTAWGWSFPTDTGYVSVSAVPARGTVGEPISLMGSAPSFDVPGYVQFTLTDSRQTLADVPTVHGRAPLEWIPLESGDLKVDAIYYASTHFFPSPRYTLHVPVDPRPTGSQPAHVTLTATANNVALGASTVLTAQVDPPAADGTVLIYDRAHHIETHALINHATQTTVTFDSPGPHQYGVLYLGNAMYSMARDSLQIMVHGAREFPRLVVDHNLAVLGQPVTCTAVFDTALSGGVVTFYRDEYAAARIQVLNGSASYTVSDLGTGLHTFTARSLLHSESGSNTVTVQVGSGIPGGLHLLAPNGGELLAIGTVTPIRWDTGSTSVAPRVSLSIQRTPSGPWEVIDADAPNTGSYNWLTTGPATGTLPALLRAARVAIGDPGGLASSDTSDAAFFITPAGALDVAGGARPATALSLSAPRPCPASGPVRCEFSLPRATRLRISVLDLAGREVQVISNGVQGEGRHAFLWDARSDQGPAAAGLYFLRLATPEASLVRRVTILR